MSEANARSPIAIAIHGGAGTILREQLSDAAEQDYRNSLTNAIQAGHAVLQQGGSSRDAVITAVVVMEDSLLFNAGRGAVLNHQGNAELDAAVMDGEHLEAGAIAGVTTVKNPIRLANAVLNHSPHVLLIGEGAETFAAGLPHHHAIERVDPGYFLTERRQQQLARIQANDLGTALSEDESAGTADDNKFGTVGAVAIDYAGNLAAATSTGGMANQRFGRVGDSPVIGAGTYADNATAAISATGHGEYFIRAVVAHDICARMRYLGESLQQATDTVVNTTLMNMGGDGGVIAIDRHANCVLDFNCAGMYRAVIDKHGNLSVAIFRSQ